MYRKKAKNSRKNKCEIVKSEILPREAHLVVVLLRVEQSSRIVQTLATVTQPPSLTQTPAAARQARASDAYSLQSQLKLHQWRHWDKLMLRQWQTDSASASATSSFGAVRYQHMLLLHLTMEALRHLAIEGGKFEDRSLPTVWHQSFCLCHTRCNIAFLCGAYI